MALKRMEIFGRPATVCFLTEMGGKVTTPEDCGVVMVVYDDGGRAIFFHHKKEQAAPEETPSSPATSD